jgi:hypothetical protein
MNPVLRYIATPNSQLLTITKQVSGLCTPLISNTYQPLSVVYFGATAKALSCPFAAPTRYPLQTNNSNDTSANISKLLSILGLWAASISLEILFDNR